MKKAIVAIVLVIYSTHSWAQYHVGKVRTWDRFPPEVQLKGYGIYASRLIQMDDDPQLEDVILFCSDNGHYPYFDLFKMYYVIVGNYTKRVKYQSDVVISTQRKLILEDRNKDGRFEIYRSYFSDGKFTVDRYGNNLNTTWAFDCISF